MSIEQLASLAELLGVFGVIASLLYVGKQVQQNTVQMKVDASTTQAQWTNDAYYKIARDREFAELWHKGMSKYSSLDEVDKVRLQCFETGGLSAWSHMYELYRSNLLREEQWLFLTGNFTRIGSRDSMREAWRLTKHDYNQGFQQCMSEFLE